MRDLSNLQGSTRDQHLSLVKRYHIITCIFSAHSSKTFNFLLHVHVPPGQDVSVASSTDDTSIKTDSGTVYAAAAVAGVAIQNLIQIREVRRPVTVAVCVKS